MGDVIALTDTPENAIEEGAMNIVETLIDLLEPLEFESVVLCVDGSEPFASREIANGLVLDITATLRAWCECCEIDGTHHHENCEHPCCPENDVCNHGVIAGTWCADCEGQEPF